MKTVTNPTTKIIRWIREILLPLAILVGFSATVHFVRLAWAITTHAASEQTAPVAIEAERHHVLLLQNNHVRVFALTLPPGAQSLVQHEHNYVTIQMEEHEVIMWKDGESPIPHFRLPMGGIHFFLGGSAQGIRNDTNAEYRDVTVEFLDPQVTTYGYRHESGQYEYGPNVTGPPVDSEGHFVNSINLEKAVASDVQLLPGESLPAANGPQLLVAVTPLEFLASTDHTIAIKPGDFLWRNAGSAALPSASAKRMRLGVIEFSKAK
jgi:hypothetical protein